MIFEQDRQCMYNVTLRCACITIAAVEEQWVLSIMNVCLYFYLSYLACKLHLFHAALCCNQCPICLYRIFPYYLINGMIISKKLLNIKMGFLMFCTTYVWNISHCEKNGVRHYHTYVQVFKSCTCYSCWILMKHEFSW